MSHHCVIATGTISNWRGKFCAIGELSSTAKACWYLVVRDGLEQTLKALLEDNAAWWELNPAYTDPDVLEDSHTFQCHYCRALPLRPHHEYCIARSVKQGRIPGNPHVVVNYGLAYPPPGEWLDKNTAEWPWISEVYLLDREGIHVLDHDYADHEEADPASWDPRSRVEIALYRWSDQEPDWRQAEQALSDHWDEVLNSRARDS